MSTSRTAPDRHPRRRRRRIKRTSSWDRASSSHYFRWNGVPAQVLLALCWVLGAGCWRAAGLAARVRGKWTRKKGRSLLFPEINSGKGTSGCRGAQSYLLFTSKRVPVERPVFFQKPVQSFAMSGHRAMAMWLNLKLNGEKVK